MNYMKKNNLSLSRFTTIKIGGIAENVFFPLSQEGIVDVFKEIAKSGKAFFVLGGGSNVVIDDGRLNCSVIMTSHLTKYQFTDNEGEMEVEAGLNLSILAELAAGRIYKGLEFCYGLPGTVGGAVFMNARAYEKEMADFIQSVIIYDYQEKVFRELKKDECAFAYKESIFQKKNWFIYKVKFQLNKGDSKSEIFKKMEDYKYDRKEKGQYNQNSAGCAFKNNYALGVSSGRVIDELGLKGLAVGGIKVYEKHANFLVNTGGATFQDYVNMVKEIRHKVQDAKGILLEPEVRFLPADKNTGL